MRVQNFNLKSMPLPSSLRRSVIGLSILLLMTCASVSVISAQNSTNSTLVINGQRFVLVPEKTFSKIEKLTDEMPAIRAENSALKAKSANDDLIIAKDAELLKAKDDRALALERAIKAETDRADALSLAYTASQNALKVSQDDRARLEKKVKKYRNYAVLGGIATVLTYVLLR